jgi:mediator of RNA polymerase II transcription subunit 5
LSEINADSVLVLFRSYPGDTTLQFYLKHAVHAALIPVSTFISTLLQAARSTDLHVPSTLAVLLRTALDAHYSSSQAPIGSVVSFNEPPSSLCRTIQDALALLRTAHTLPTSNPQLHHQLTSSAGELLILLLACMTDLSRVPGAQAVHLYGEMSETMAVCRFRLDEDDGGGGGGGGGDDRVAGVLETFLVSLSLLIGDDVTLRAAREAQMMHHTTSSSQFGGVPQHGKPGEIGIVGPSSETDVITLGLLLNSMVKVHTQRAS